MRARDNPFAAARLDQLPFRLEDGCPPDWPGLFRRMEQLNHRGAIVGPHGAGKTTFLDALAPRLAARDFEVMRLTLTRERPRLDATSQRLLARGPGRRQFLLLDGAEQLPWPAWLALRWRARRAGGLIVTTHRPGRLPTLLCCRTNPALLAGIVSELLGGKAPGCDLDALHARHGGNVRDALRELYDRFAAADGA